MARQLRVEFPGAIYHITARANGGQDLFVDDQDRRYFLSRVSESVEMFQVRLYLFCLMSTHFHVVVETPRGNLSRFMHSVLTGYGVYFNQHHRRHGHVTQGRYGCRLVEGNEYLLRLSRYVHLNPVKTERMKEVALRDMVEYLRGYAWSSYPSYIGMSRRMKLVDYGPMLSLISGKRDQARIYRRYVESGIGREDEEFLAALQMSPRSIGGEKFREWVDECYRELLQKKDVREDASFRHTGKSVPVEVVMVTVARAAKVQMDELVRRRRDWTVRGVTCMMLCKHAGLTQRDTAKVMGLGTGAAVSYQVRKLNKAVMDDEALRRLVRRIERKLGKGA